MIPSLTEPITKLLNRDRSPFSSRPKQTDFSSPSSAEFSTFIFSGVCCCVCSLLGSFQRSSAGGFGNIIIESMLMDSFISEVCRIAALNLGELRRIVDCSI